MTRSIRSGARHLVVLSLLLIAAGPSAAQTTGEIAGAVVDEKDRALAGVTVVIPQTGREVLTDSAGRFRIPDLEVASYGVEARAAGFTVERRDGVMVRPGETTELSFRLVAVPIPLDEIVVTPSRYSILREKPTSSMELDREEILALPHLFDDLYRAVTVLPGTSGNDISGRFSVRGGLHHEVLVELDGLELYEPFHLKDFQGPFTIIDPEALGAVDLDTGGFPAEYGDRMGGVLDMATIVPKIRRTGFSISFTTTQASTAGVFGDGRGSWLASLRRGYLDIVLNFVDGDNDFSPKYWDALGKITWSASSKSQLAFQLLWADDTLVFEEEENRGSVYHENREADTAYGSAYAWARHDAILGSSIVVSTALAASRIDRDRRFFEDEYYDYMDMRDERQLDVYSLKQDWSVQPAERHYLKWGFDLRRLEAEYDYDNTYVLNPILAEYRDQPPAGRYFFIDDFSGEQIGVYAADRLRLGKKLTVELGARYDEQTLVDDSQVSPRLNLVYALGRASALRVAWGRFYQSQRLYELQVEDGETAFHDAERAEHRIIGWEHTFGRGLVLSIDAYQREVGNPRPRWESLFDTWAPFPEIKPDRVLIAPATSNAEGVEVFLRRRGGKRFNWWAHYTWSSVEDEIDGLWVPRNIDQEHALVLDANYRRTHWSFNAAWRYHTGWPTTAIWGEWVRRPNGSWDIVPVLGPYYAENLSDYHRLDVRASRSWQLDRGTLSLFIDVQNLYDRKNERGTEFEDADFFVLPNGDIVLSADDEEWLGMIPSFGIGWEF